MINTTKHFLFALFCMCMVITGCDNDTVLKISHTQPVGHPTDQSVRIFKQNIADEFSIKVYPNASLGANEKVLELVRAGVIEFVAIGTTQLEPFDKTYAYFSQPWRLKSVSEYEQELVNADLIAKLNKNRDINKFEVLALYKDGVRNFYCRTPIKSLSDLQGKKIRIQTGESNIKMIQMLNASPVVMSYGEVYSALQQGVIDCAENNETALTDHKHAEVAPWYLQDQHQMIPIALVTSTKFMDSLTPEQQMIIRKAALKSAHNAIDIWNIYINKTREKAKSMGAHFIEVSSAP